MAEDGARRQWAVAAAAAVALLAGLGWAVWRWLAAQGIDVADLDPAAARSFIEAWGAWAALGAVLLMVLHSFLPLPAEIIAAGTGMAFGPWLGIVLTWSGAMLGAILSFALARWLGRPFVRRLLPTAAWRRLDTIPTRPSTLLFVRLVPVISFNLVNYAAGLLGVRWWTFLWTTGLGILPLAIVMVVLGYEMLSAPWWAWALAAVVMLGGWLLWRRARPG